MTRRTRLTIAISAAACLPFALAACGSSSSSDSSSSPSSSASSSAAPSASPSTYRATPPAGVEALTVVVNPGSIAAGQTVSLGASGSKSLAGKTAYVITKDAEVASEIWVEGKPIGADGTVGFALGTLQRTYEFQVVVPAQPLATKEYPANTKLTAESAVFPITVTGS